MATEPGLLWLAMFFYNITEKSVAGSVSSVRAGKNIHKKMRNKIQINI